MIKELPRALRAARRRLLDIPEYEMISDFEWLSKMQRWSLHFRLNLSGIVHANIPASQEWYALVDDRFPHGHIIICPATDNGINATFQHQMFNAPSKDGPWREGVICVNTSLNKWGRKELTNEPVDDEDKLGWHVQRTVDWLKAAATDSLVNPGEPFELPCLPPTKQQEIVIFCEGTEMLATWQQSAERSGIAQLKPVGDERYIIEAFGDKQGSVKYRWGKYIGDKTTSSVRGLWVRFNRVPTMYPYQLPQTWAELLDVADKQHIPLYELLVEQLKQCKSVHPTFILLGFPIPAIYGGADHSMYWMAVRMPELPPTKGFRNLRRVSDHQLKALFQRGAALKWCVSQNWHRDEISTRGKLSKAMSDAKLVIIGAGAVGSSLSEILVRLGMEHLTILDGETLTAGNLCRHTLSLTDIRYAKARRLADRLNSLSPHVKAEYRAETLQQVLQREPSIFTDSTLVIDTTGNDDVIYQLAANGTLEDKQVFSISLGLEANRLYCYGGVLQKDKYFAERFFSALQPWLLKDQQQASLEAMPREGIGCWHPVFPARYDDLLLLLNAVIREIERRIEELTALKFVVIEKQVDASGNFVGITLIRE